MCIRDSSYLHCGAPRSSTRLSDPACNSPACYCAISREASIQSTGRIVYNCHIPQPASSLTPRHLRPRLLEALGDSRAVALLGARQVGKSTLVHEIARSAYPAEYISLDEPAAARAAHRARCTRPDTRIALS